MEAPVTKECSCASSWKDGTGRGLHERESLRGPDTAQSIWAGLQPTPQPVVQALSLWLGRGNTSSEGVSKNFFLELSHSGPTACHKPS